MRIAGVRGREEGAGPRRRPRSCSGAAGTLQANVGFESYELGPGDSIAFDSSTPHEYLNKTGDYVHAIWVVVHSEPGRA